MHKTIFLLLATTLTLSGCNLFDKDGKLDLQITDAPYTDAQAVVVTIRSVRLQPVDGDAEDFDLNPQLRVDLLQLRNGAVRQLLSSAALPSGDYRAISLRLADGSNDSHVQTQSGGVFELDVPDNELDLDTDFSIDDRGVTKLTLDVDLRRSLRAPDRDGDPYRLVPSLRLVNNDEVGTISGTIRGALIGNGCVAAVYVYQGKVTPDDLGGSGAQAYSSTDVIAAGDGSYRYSAAFLPEGDYSLALTCDADQDDPARDDNLDFSDAEQVTVRKQRTATQDF